MNFDKLEKFVNALQAGDGRFISQNSVKATAEYMLVQQFCSLSAGSREKARKFLRGQIPYFAAQQVTKGFDLMEHIWQIAAGIPQDTLFLSDSFLRLCLSEVMPVSTKSSLLLVLLLQNIDKKMSSVLKEVITYQKTLFTTVSLNTLYETTHNVITLWAARDKYPVQGTINECCVWLSKNVTSFDTCIDLLAETAGVCLSFADMNKKKKNIDSSISQIFSVLDAHQNEDGGFPVFSGGESEFHSSLTSLWAYTASTFQRGESTDL